MTPDPNRRTVKIVSGILIAAGLLLLVSLWIPGYQLDLALPLVFLMLGAACIALVYVISPEYRQAAYLYIPGGLLLAFGTIFLLNVVTGDRSAWAYAWLLLITGAGAGVSLTARKLGWRQEILLAGEGAAFLSVILFALFGAIAGGTFIRVMAPILLVLGGLALRHSGLEKLLAERMFPRHKQALSGEGTRSSGQSPQNALVEPLSKREIEVLRLIDQGLSNAEIAGRLSLAQSTVKTHINNIYGKLEVQTRTQAVRRARELGLFEGQARYPGKMQ